MNKNYTASYFIFVKLQKFSLFFLTLNVHAHVLALGSQNENSLGMAVSGYKYNEPGLMTLRATMLELNYSGTRVWAPHWPQTRATWFVRADLALASGRADYRSPFRGDMNDTDNWYVDARGLLGRDFHLGSAVLSPYVGLGFRHLHNDIGYRRTTQYTTMPIGITHKVRISPSTALHSNFEYIHLLQGVHTAKLSDTSSLISDVKLKQPKGFGLRMSTMWRHGHWSMGPTLTYWNIDASNAAGEPPVVEPRNNTIEIGIKLNRLF